uniref:ATP synthase subunit a n=1 Tax=Phrynus sp. AH-2005 TaxID=309714 RepID=Q535G1_9ARAC|nr:ATP synthase F0 subunit 6 [Phrynus sp. AH-2005]
MMASLFSIFDPSTPPLLHLNWLSLLIPLTTFPPIFWLINSNILTIPKFILSSLFSEIKTLTSYSFTKGLTLILLSMFTFTLLNNFMGLLPHVFTATSHLMMTISMALPFWLTFMIFGWINNTTQMFSHMIPVGTPPILSTFMVCVETISNLIRPITLSVRLSANMIAGHLILALLSNCFSLSTNSIPMMIPEIMLISLESAVAIIQAYVFTILICLYSTEIH